MAREYEPPAIRGADILSNLTFTPDLSPMDRMVEANKAFDRLGISVPSNQPDLPQQPGETTLTAPGPESVGNNLPH